MQRSRKRIAVLTPGGVGNEESGMHIPALFELIERLSCVHELHVYSLAPAHWTRRNGSCGNAEVTYLPAHHGKDSIKKVFSLISSVARDNNRHRYDLLHALWAIPCGVAAIVLRKRLAIPSLVTFLGGETARLKNIRYGNQVRWSTRFATRQVVRHSDAVVALTQYQMQQIESARNEASIRRVIPFGANTTLFTPNEKFVRTRPLKLLFVGNLHAVKDYVTLLMTFKLIRSAVDARLRIIGSDHADGNPQKVAHDLGVAEHCDFVGHVAHSQLSPHYHWAHVLLLTSRHEAQGVVVAEAAASGVFVAGTRTGLLADFGEKMAVVSEIGDYDTLARKILDVISSPDKYEVLRDAGLNWARTHNLEWTAMEYDKLYDDVLQLTRSKSVS